MDDQEKSSISGQQFVELMTFLEKLQRQANHRPEQPEELTIIQKIQKVIQFYKDVLQGKQEALQTMNKQCLKVRQYRDMYLQRNSEALRKIRHGKKDSNEKNQSVNPSPYASANPNPNQKKLDSFKSIFPSKEKKPHDVFNSSNINFQHDQVNTSGNIKKQMAGSVFMDKSSFNSLSEHDDIFTQLKKRYAVLEQQSKDKESTIYKLQKKVKHLYQRMGKYQLKAKKMSELQDKCKDLDIKIRDSNEELQFTKNLLEKSKEEIKHKQMEIKNLQDQVDQLSYRFKELAEQMERFECSSQQREQQLQTAKRKVFQLTEQNERLSHSLQDQKQNFQQKIDRIKGGLQKQHSERVRELVEQNSKYVMQIGKRQNQTAILRDKLNVCAQYMGNFIGFCRRSDGSQKFEEWFKEAQPLLKKYKNCRLEYPYFEWIQGERKLNEKLARGC